MKIAMIVTIVIALSTTNVTGYTLPPIRESYDCEELVWCGGSKDTLVLLWGDGSLCYSSTGYSTFTPLLRLEKYDYGRTQVMLARESPVSLCIVQTRESSYDVTFVDLSTGKIRGRTTLSQSMTREFVGYAKDATSFYVRSGTQLGSMNVETGAVTQVAEIKGADSISCQVRMLEDGKGYLVIDGWKIIARDMGGNELWRKGFGDKVHGEMANRQPSWPWMALFCESISDDSKMWYECIDIRTGKEVWKRPVPGFGDLAAVSDDGKQQAWNTSEGLTITSLPADRIVKAKDITWRAEGVFLDNGRILACVPELESGLVAPKTNEYTLKRKSQDIWFIDAASGTTIKKLDAKRPARGDPNALGKQLPAVR